jgi:hypothetical protein
MAPRKTLLQAKTEILALKELPMGYRVDCDGKTDNLLVVGPKLGFCITREAINEGYHTSMFVPSLNALIEAEATGLPAPVLPPIERKVHD